MNKSTHFHKEGKQPYRFARTTRGAALKNLLFLNYVPWHLSNSDL